MHSINCLLFLLVIGSRLTVQEVRRNREKPGPKSDMSLTTSYHRNYKRQWNQRTRAKARANHICARCLVTPSRDGKACLSCRGFRRARTKGTAMPETVNIPDGMTLGEMQKCDDIVRRLCELMAGVYAEQGMAYIHFTRPYPEENEALELRPMEEGQ